MGCEILGRENAKFTLNITNDINNTFESIQDNTTDWIIEDTLLDSTDNTTILEDISYLDTPTKIFESKGTKDIQSITDFDDGWGNIYQHETNLTVEAKVYIEPILDFDWLPQEPTILDTVQFTQLHDDIRDMTIPKKYGRIDEVRVDFYNDGVYEEDFILDLDVFNYQFLTKQDNIPIRLNTVYWDGWEYQSIELIKSINMANIPPVSDWDREDNGVCIPAYLWTATSTDLDDDDALLSFKWELYQEVGTVWNLIETSTDKEFTYPFQYEGVYKIDLITTDLEGVTNTKTEEFNIAFSTCDSSGGGSCQGKLILQPNRWQLVAIPVNGKKISDVMDVIATKTGGLANAVIEVANAYPSTDTIGGTFLSFVPDFTNIGSTNNFDLVMDDGTVREITAFWIKTLDFIGEIEINYTSDTVN